MPMLGDKPFEGWASGYDVDVYVESDSPEKAEYDSAVNKLLADGYIRYSSTRALATPTLVGVMAVLAEVVGGDAYYLDEELTFADVKVKRIRAVGEYAQKSVCIRLIKGSKIATISHMDVVCTKAYKEVSRDYLGDCPAYFIHPAPVMELLAKKLAELG